MHCPDGNDTDPIWRVLAFSRGISSWTPLKSEHSNPNPKPLVNQLWRIDFLTPPHPASSLKDSLPSLNILYHSKTDARFMQDGRKAVWSIPYVSLAFFPSSKQNFIAYHYSLRPDCIFEIYHQWQSGFSRVYSNCCCSCLFEDEIIRCIVITYWIFKSLRQFLMPQPKNLETYLMSHLYIYIYIYIYANLWPISVYACVCVWHFIR